MEPETIQMHRLVHDPADLEYVPAPIKTVYDDARTELDAFAKDEAAIKRDPRLSELAKSERLAARAQAAFAKITPHEESLTTGFEAAAVQREQAAIEKARTQFDGGRANLIISHFAGLDGMARLQAVTDAINTGDLETLSAIAGAPKILKLLDDKLYGRVKDAIFAKVEPLAVRSVAQSRFSSERTRRAVEDFYDEVSKRARVPKPIPKWRVGR